VIIADREMVESASDDILHGADASDVAFLVVGDPFGHVSSPAPLPSIPDF
jgi:diphthine synthase